MSGSAHVAGSDSGAVDGRWALSLVSSDAIVQGARYAFILYLGAQSLSELGSFLMGSALGALAGALSDFGISQHWLRLTTGGAQFSGRAFIQVMRGKAIALMLTATVFGCIMLTVPWKPLLWLPLAGGLTLMLIQSLGESCEAVGLLCREYATVVWFRIGVAIGLYAGPVVGGLLLEHVLLARLIEWLLSLSIGMGVVLLVRYVMKVATLLPEDEGKSLHYGEAWWQARWLGLNQLAIVMDVRMPLIILGAMLGETAVGLYGLVQRTTAVVETVWASVSRLLLTSYSAAAGKEGVEKVRARVISAATRTGWLTGAGMLLLIGLATFVARHMTLTESELVALSLLQWAVLAITLSSMKRPFVAGLLALYQEYSICRLNMGIAVAGLILVPLLIGYVGIWGPVFAWIVLEAVACVAMVYAFLNAVGRHKAKVSRATPAEISL